MSGSRGSSAAPRVVVVGAGFAGLSVAKALARAAVDLIVVDRRNHHLFQPLLYQVATAALSPAEIAWPVRHVLRRQKNATVLLAEATAVDLDARTVTAGGSTLAYDFLVLAPGNTPAYFGRDEWAAAAPGPKTLEDAVGLRRRILSAFERAEANPAGRTAGAFLTFVVVGGGPTGVEMAGAIAEVARDALPREFRRIDTRSARIVLVEAGSRILPQLPEDLATYAARELARLGVEVRTAARVTAVDEAGVDLADGRLEAATVVWAAGVATDALVRTLPVDRDRQGRALVGSTCRCPAGRRCSSSATPQPSPTRPADPFPASPPPQSRPGGT
jgi:NADH dehydrogenase